MTKGIKIFTVLIGILAIVAVVMLASFIAESLENPEEVGAFFGKIFNGFKAVTQ